jgi:hypothetical protein
MPLHVKMPFYLFLIYPIFGYITINFFGQPPFVFISLFVIVAFLDRIGRSRLIFPGYHRYFLLFIISVAISKYFVNGFSLKIDTHFAQVFYSILALFFFIIIENTRFSKLFIKNGLRIIKILVFAAAAVSIIQYFNASFFANTHIYTGHDDEVIGYARRIMSIFTWGDFNASRYLTIGFVVMYGILIVETKSNKTLHWTIQLLVATVIFTGQARIAMVTFLIATLMLVYNKVSVKNILVIVFSGIAFIVLLNILEFNLDYFVEQRLKSDSAYTRLEAFNAFFHAFPEKPFFGTGGVRTDALFEGFGHVAQMHNAHLNIAYFYGIFALIFHTLFLYYLTKKTYKTAKEAGYWPPFVGILVYITATMTMPSGYFLEPGLIIMMVFNKYHYDQYLLRKYSSQNMTVERGNHLTLNKVSNG